MLRQYGSWLRDAGVAWYQDNAMRMSSSIAYYALLSLAPTLLLAVSFAGFFMGDQEARSRVADLLTTRLGDKAGAAVESIIVATDDAEESGLGTFLGFLMLFIGASGVFGELQSAMNTIWKVAPRPGRGLWAMLRARFFCFAMVGSVAVLLLALLVVGALLALLGARIGSLPGGVVVWQVVDFSLSLIAVAALFAITYKIVPDVQIPLRDVWPGALLTALMFAVGELGIGLYLSYWAVPKPTGAAGALVVLVIWVYYSGQILFYGAEFTKVRATARGVPIVPRKYAMRTPGADAVEARSGFERAQRTNSRV